MASPGPAPKHPSERRNRTAPVRGEFIEIDKPVLNKDEIKLRALTSLEQARLNHKARQKWRIWRREPVTRFWTQSEVDFALDTLELFNCDDWTRNAGEIRLRMDRLALTPEGKKRQRYKITFGGIGREQSKDRPPPDADNVVHIDSRLRDLHHDGRAPS
jgi:hypothetical protein